MADQPEHLGGIPPNVAEFVQLEQLVAKIQQELAPDAKVLHNVVLDGRKSGRKRQIDVLVRHRIGQYEIRIVIECKDYSRPVDVKGVEEFYGLFDDVGAQKGVLVCPKGFTQAAKERARGLQIDLYSPVDTSLHKWKVKVSLPAVCDFRSAQISLDISMSAPYPFRIMPDFFSSNIIFGNDGINLGTIEKAAIQKWNSGDFPIEPGEYENLPIFGGPTQTDNGYGRLVPVDLYAGLLVERQLFFGQYNIKRISGFKDEIKGGVIANAFQLGLLSEQEVEETWQTIAVLEEAPIAPVLILTGLYGWVED